MTNQKGKVYGVTAPLSPASLSHGAKKLIEKFDTPLPPLSISEIWRSMMLHRNEKFLFRRECSASGASFISAYDNDVPFPVYTNPIWWGDGWDAAEYGRPFDFNKTFFQQFKDLQNVVPREGTSVFSSQNCDYNSHTRECKNCYLNTLAVKSELAFYCYWAVGNHSTVDCLISNGSTLCYEAIDCENCYECVQIKDCHNCSQCSFSYDLRNCNYCIGCSNLRFKEYHVFNKPVSKDEFFAIQSKLLNGTQSAYEKGRKIFDKVYQTAKHRCSQKTNCIDCKGDHLINCKNCDYCFDSDNSEDCHNSIALNSCKDVLFASSAGWPGCELIYYSTVSRGCTNLRFCYYSWFSHNLSYCDGAVSSSDCFGCIGMRRKKNCILNKAYSQHEYETLVARIIPYMKETGEWGAYFPPELSTFCYNDTQAQEYFPLSRKDALKRGYRWRDLEEIAPDSSSSYPLPESLETVDDDIISKRLHCQESERAYTIQKGELEIYRTLGIPIPRTHPDTRHSKRMKWRNERKLFERICGDCSINMLTSYAPEFKSNVVCEECYNKALS